MVGIEWLLVVNGNNYLLHEFKSIKIPQKCPYSPIMSFQTSQWKLWSVYLHACVRFVEGDVLTNSSLRERFGLKVSSSGMMSRLIKEAMAQKLIKPIDPTTAPRYMKYIPIWA